MHLPEIDKYAHLDSPLHRWDPRARLASMTVLLLAVVLSPTYPAALAGLALSLALLALSRIPLPFVFLHLRWVLLFCAVLTAALCLTSGGEALWRAGPVALSRSGVHLGGLITIRAAAAVILIFPMAGTSRFHVTLKALRRLHAPQVAVQILAFSYRYVFVLYDEVGRMLAAARARASARAGVARRLTNTGNMVGMLLIRSTERTSRVQRAMIARGYRGEVRTLDRFQIGWRDVLKAALCLAAAGMLVVAGLGT